MQGGESGNARSDSEEAILDLSLNFYEEEQKILDEEYSYLEKKRKFLNVVTLIFLGAYSVFAGGVSSVSCS